MKNILFKALLTCGLLFIVSCVNNNQYDLIIKNGMVYDGSGTEPYEADIGINADSIEVIGDLSSATAKKYVDAEGKAVSPGFINILSWATESLFEDGRSFSNIYQGITLEVFGEGVSMGPRNEEMKKDRNNYNWTTLNEYLEYLTEQGISPNVASFVGATTLRIHEVGYNDRPATDQELQNMKDLVRLAMEEGALGIGSSLIYAPAFYASTEELIELNKVAAEYDGMYISHLRSEGNKLLESIDELITIAEQAGIRAQIYHLKAVGEQNWHKIDLAIAKIDSANNAGLEISADMYTYPAGATGLNAAMPPWVQEGGFNAWRNRLQDPEIRQRVLREMRNPTDDWENYFYSTGPDRMLLVGFRNDELKKYTGKTLIEVAAERGTSPAETVLDLVIEDRSRVETIYTFMSEENVRKKIRQPWMSFETDAASVAPEGKFLESNVHPRAYGTFSRLLGKYVRDEKVITLQEAIRRITTLPASKLKIQKRGALKEGYFADLVIFDPETIQDHATFSEPHQLSTGIIHVFVNGKQVLENEKHTGETPGRVVYGPGKK
ncbi:MAG: D-aminoacylase [Balneolaceae bacterium]